MSKKRSENRIGQAAKLPNIPYWETDEGRRRKAEVALEKDTTLTPEEKEAARKFFLQE
jgi:hypothetical protein